MLSFLEVFPGLKERTTSVLTFNISSTKTCLQDGMQREIFEKFLAKLDKHCESVLIGSEIDYRRLIAERSINQVRIKQLLFLRLSAFGQITYYLKYLHDFHK